MAILQMTLWTAMLGQVLMKNLYIDLHFTEVCSEISNGQYVSIGSGNAWCLFCNGDPVHHHMYALPNLNKQRVSEHFEIFRLSKKCKAVTSIRVHPTEYTNFVTLYFDVMLC